jgi:site-specific DNA-methyltransferase (adenine-specific)
MNHLYYGDNLTVLRESVATASVDLIYLDPPFNSNAGYNVLFKAPDGSGSAAQIEAFDDTWHWNDSAEAAFADVLRSGNGAAAEMLRAMRGFLGENDMMAYLAMMAARLIERAVQVPARRDDAFRKAPREEDTKAQGRFDL